MEIFLYRIRIDRRMKFFTATFFTTLLLSLSTVMAQDASVVPIPDKVPSEPQSLASPSPAPFSLMPDNMPPPVEKPSHRGTATSDTRPAAPIVKKNKTEENTDNIADRIKFREAKTKAIKDEKVIDLEAQAEAAKTDPEKRAILRQYYTVLYAKILKIDGSIKKLVAERLKQSLNSLDQSRVRPKGYEETLATH